jgi:eukaryotic-like serine/threonine-protein kinase
MLLQSCNEFLQTLRKSGLVAPEQLDDFLQRSQLPDQPLDLAKVMISSNLITGFQAEQLLQGKTRGFDLGRYRILKRLGGGATGAVFLCEHLLMKHRVAIKVLSREWMEREPTALARFRREARAASSLEHPNIVKTIDLDEDDERHYLVMEYIEGISLEGLVKQRKQLEIRDAVYYVAQALQGLEHINQSGLVHRDMKPANLLLDKTGTIKILDMGLARFTDGRNDNLTIQQGSMIMGTVDFMSPEQGANGSQVDIRSDIYSLGSTLFYLLTGQSPVPDGTIAQRIIALQFHPPKPIRSLRPEVDPRLDAILGKMMTKNIALRYQSPMETLADLTYWLKTYQPSTIQANHPSPKPIPQALVDTLPGMPLQEASETTVDSEPLSKTTSKNWIWISIVGLTITIGLVAAILIK